MKPKKHQKANLNNYTDTFLLIGLVVSLYAVYQIINLKTESQKIDLDKVLVAKMDIDQTKVIKIEEPKPKSKMKIKPRIIDKLKLIKDDSNKIESKLLPTDPTDEPINIDSLETATVETPDIEVSFIKVEQAPAFPGCVGNNEQLKKCLNEKIRRFVAKKFNTGIAEDLGLSGERVKIFTQFTIDKDGKIIQIKARSKYKGLEKEALRVIHLLPQMKPGKQRNMPVKVTYTLPIIFKVE